MEKRVLEGICIVMWGFRLFMGLIVYCIAYMYRKEVCRRISGSEVHRILLCVGVKGVSMKMNEFLLNIDMNEG